MILPSSPYKRPPPDKTVVGAVATVAAYAIAGPIAYGLKNHFYGSSAKTLVSKVGRYAATSFLCGAFWTSAAIYEHSHIMENQVKPKSRLLIESTPCLSDRTLNDPNSIVECQPRNMGEIVTPIFRFRAGPYFIQESRHYRQHNYSSDTSCATSVVAITGPGVRKDLIDWYPLPLICRKGADSPLTQP